MKIVLPVSGHDAARLPLLVDTIIHFAGLQAHDLLLVPTASATLIANEQADRLRSVCPNVAVAPMDNDPPWGWFTAPNMQFFFAVHHMHTVLKQRTGWFWMEVDCVPVKADWANQLAAAYMAGGKPFCGHVVDTPYRDAQGNVAPTPLGDTMMMGCGIYPPGMPADIEIAPLFFDLCKPPPFNADQPWDVYLRWVMNKRGVAHTPLIGDMWNTGNYRREGETLVCDALPSKHPGRARGGVVPPECVVVHGCKDESLYRQVMGQQEDRMDDLRQVQDISRANLSLTAEAPPPPPPPEPDGSEGAQGQINESQPVGYTLDAPAPQQDDPPGTYSINPLVNRMRIEYVKLAAENRATLKALGSALKEPPKALEPLLTAAGLEVRGPAKWLALSSSSDPASPPPAPAPPAEQT